MDEEKVNVNQHISGEREAEEYHEKKAKSRTSQEQVYNSDNRDEVVGDQYYEEVDDYQQIDTSSQVAVMVDSKKDVKAKEEALNINSGMKKEVGKGVGGGGQDDEDDDLTGWHT